MASPAFPVFLWLCARFCLLFTQSELQFQFLISTEKKSPPMLIPKKQRQTIYLALFQDGVMVAHKDYNAPKHSEVETRNLFVIKAMQVIQ